MNKKLLALAVTSALAGGTTAQADTANVNVYGKLYPQFMQSSAHGASDAAAAADRSTLVPASQFTGANVLSRHEVNSQNSYVGFKGEADVGGGMKGWFQVEQSVELDAGNGTWSSRNSAAGLSGGFGNFFLGRWDTVYKQLGDPVSFLGISSSNFVSTSNTLSIAGFGQAARNTRFHERLNNWIEYDTPSIGGFQLLAGYTPDEAKTVNRNRTVESYGVKWEAGPLYLAFAHETHNDFLALGAASGIATNANRSKDTADRISGKFSFGSTEIGVDYAQMEYKENPTTATAPNQYKHNSYAIVGLQKLGNLQVAASYTKSEKGTCSLAGGGNCSTNGLDATQYSLGVKYDFSKRVGVFAIASQIKNGASATHSNISSSVQPGADPEAIAAGIVINF